MTTLSYPDYCELTYRAEGGYLPVVLRPHWPGGCSGVTIGPGYDMGHRAPQRIVSDLTAVGVRREDAEALSRANGLIGERAGAWAKANRWFTLTPEQSRALFCLVYPTYVARARAWCSSVGGRLDAFPRRLQEVLVDMAYRGDLEPHYGRAQLGHAVATGDARGLEAAICETDYWQRVCNLERLRDAQGREIPGRAGINPRHIVRAEWARDPMREGAELRRELERRTAPMKIG